MISDKLNKTAVRSIFLDVYLYTNNVIFSLLIYNVLLKSAIFQV